MKRQLTIIAAMFAASSVSAQGIFDADDQIDDQVESIEESVQDDFDQTGDARDFGVSRQNGSYGSIALTGNVTSGNTETTDIGLGSRFGFTNGANGHDFTLSYLYGEEEGEKSANEGRFSYDYTRSFSSNFYGFGDLTASYDEFSSYESDVFVGAGLGYRVINTPTTSWSVQGGPGYRMVQLDEANSDGEDSFEEVAGIVSSKYYQQLSEGAAVTMDTDVFFSENDTAVTNDLGLTVSMGGPLALRTSLLTEYHTDPLDGRDDTDNTLGVSVVYSFR